MEYRIKAAEADLRTARVSANSHHQQQQQNRINPQTVAILESQILQLQNERNHLQVSKS